ncbi:RNA-directed DNA polymerase, eukaryota [Tanacetum coccineum]
MEKKRGIPLINSEVIEMICIKISGLSLCAWWSNAHKKVVNAGDKFMFFEIDQGSSMVNRKNHIVRVQEIVAWSTQIMDDTVSEDATSENDEEVSDIEEELYLVDENIKEVDEFEKELKGKWTNSDDMHFMINIYGPRDTYDKAVLWNSVCLFTQTHNDKFMSFGDLNEVRDESERYGSTFSRLEADCFNSFIEVMNLVVMPMGGRRFTCMNKSETKLSRLDHFIVGVHYKRDSRFEGYDVRKG